MSVPALLALWVIAMLMLSGLRLEMRYRRALKVGAGVAAGAGRPAVARPSLRSVPDPYSD